MVMARPDWVVRRCPYCYEPLGYFEYLKRKKRKICTCKKCKKVIDEQHIVWQNLK